MTKRGRINKCLPETIFNIVHAFQKVSDTKTNYDFMMFSYFLGSTEEFLFFIL